MVTKEISNFCYPVTIKIDQEMKNGTLVLNVVHGKELEIEYAKKEIIEKINSFFGYNFINQIALKIVHEKVNSKQNKFPQIKNLTKINKEIEKIDNNQLKNSLNNFVKAFNENR